MVPGSPPVASGSATTGAIGPVARRGSRSASVVSVVTSAATRWRADAAARRASAARARAAAVAVARADFAESFRAVDALADELRVVAAFVREDDELPAASPPSAGASAGADVPVDVAADPFLDGLLLEALFADARFAAAVDAERVPAAGRPLEVERLAPAALAGAGVACAPSSAEVAPASCSRASESAAAAAERFAAVLRAAEEADEDRDVRAVEPDRPAFDPLDDDASEAFGPDFGAGFGADLAPPFEEAERDAEVFFAADLAALDRAADASAALPRLAGRPPERLDPAPERPVPGVAVSP
ncbi:hypothetical protein GCM10009819_09250 [Agromyces tropicus]|uniref:Uncharacterized protein n=1 Tax=Agromyces tropicus TaxID=555371 RepID=A0ABN2U4Q1_9MICO